MMQRKSALVPASVVLVSRRYATYDDAPGLQYHFPRGRYEAQVRAAEGQLVLVYEPRRGGLSPSSVGGGRQAFVAWAVLGPILDDANREDHAYVRYLEYHELAAPVPPSLVGLNAKSLQWAVLRVADDLVESVLRHGMAPLLGANSQTVGLVERAIPFDLSGRVLREVVRQETVRDRAFRYRVIEQAYEGQCAMTGLRLTNGYGRAEVDAAHIVPVAAGGPDMVNNGLALTKTVHWAFDRGLVSVEDDGRILVVERGMPDDLRRLLRPEGRLALPKVAGCAPHPAFLSWHRMQVFKGSAA
jgi:putative restriction endonuclease